MKYDVIIIGAGPVGLAAAIEAKHQNLNLTRLLLAGSFYPHLLTYN